MKIRTVKHETFKNIEAEVSRARNLFSFPPKDVDALLFTYAGEVHATLSSHKNGVATAVDVYVSCMKLAGLAVRIAEEGATGYPYAQHQIDTAAMNDLFKREGV